MRLSTVGVKPMGDAFSSKEYESVKETLEVVNEFYHRMSITVGNCGVVSNSVHDLLKSLPATLNELNGKFNELKRTPLGASRSITPSEWPMLHSKRMKEFHSEGCRELEKNDARAFALLAYNSYPQFEEAGFNVPRYEDCNTSSDSLSAEGYVKLLFEKFREKSKHASAEDGRNLRKIGEILLSCSKSTDVWYDFSKKHLVAGKED